MKYYEEVALSLMPRNCGRILDFGCGDGSFCKKLIKRGSEVYGCDIDKELIKKAKRNIEGVSFNFIKPGGKSPYRNSYFDYVFLMGVLEHVPDERETLREMWRILKPNGSLFIYGINRSILGIFDVANIKFLFPNLHKFFYSLLLSKRDYNKEFVRKEEEGMFGDFTLGKKWHTHYSVEDLRRLFGKRFKLLDVRHFGLFLPILFPLKFIYDFNFKRTNWFLEKLINLDQKIEIPNFSYLFIAKSRKIIK